MQVRDAGEVGQAAHLPLGVARAHAEAVGLGDEAEAVAQQRRADAARALLGLELLGQDAEVELGHRPLVEVHGPPAQDRGHDQQDGQPGDGTGHDQAPALPPVGPHEHQEAEDDEAGGDEAGLAARGQDEQQGDAAADEPEQLQARVAVDDREHEQVGQAQAQEGREVVLVPEQRADADEAGTALAALAEGRQVEARDDLGDGDQARQDEDAEQRPEQDRGPAGGCGTRGRWRSRGRPAWPGTGSSAGRPPRRRPSRSRAPSTRTTRRAGRPVAAGPPAAPGARPSGGSPRGRAPGAR